MPHAPAWPARWPGPRRARRWPWTEACRACESGRDQPDVTAGIQQRSDDIDVSVWYQPGNAGLQPIDSTDTSDLFSWHTVLPASLTRPAPARAARPESATRRFP